MSGLKATSKYVYLVPIIVLTLIAVILAGCGGKKEPTASPRETIAPQATQTSESNMKLSSSAFEDNGLIPAKYAHQRVDGGQNISIPLAWTDAPSGTKSFALVMVDISARKWVHWLVVDIPASTTSLPEGASGASMPAGARELDNTFGTVGYGGPEPPPGSGVHEYVTTLYALNVEKLNLPEMTSYNGFLRTIDGKVLEEASLTGKFSR